MELPCDLCKRRRTLVAIAVESPSGRKVTRTICEDCITTIAAAQCA